MLDVKDLHAGYGRTKVVHGISFEVNAGECVALTGASGAGKSTILRALTGLITPWSGEVRLNGRRIDKLPGYAIARAGLVMCPEGRQIFPLMSVRENLMLGAFRRRDSRSACEADLREVYSLFPLLRERALQPAGILAGAERDMLAIGRALMARPLLFVFDEPSVSLAADLLSAMDETVARIRERGAAVLLVERNADMALRLADRVHFIESGEICTQGIARQMHELPLMPAALFGN